MYYVIKAGIILNYLLFKVYEYQALKERENILFSSSHCSEPAIMPMTTKARGSQSAWQVTPKRAI